MSGTKPYRIVDPPLVELLLENAEGMGVRCPDCGKAWRMEPCSALLQCACHGPRSLMRPEPIQRGYYFGLIHAQELLQAKLEELWKVALEVADSLAAARRGAAAGPETWQAPSHHKLAHWGQALYDAAMRARCC